MQFQFIRDKITVVRLEEVKQLANIKSAKKRIGITEKRTEMNKGKKTEIKTYMKKFDNAIDAGNIDEARTILNVLDKKLKRAAHNNIIHMNNASRKISRLTKKLNKAM